MESLSDTWAEKSTGKKVCELSRCCDVRKCVCEDEIERESVCAIACKMECVSECFARTSKKEEALVLLPSSCLPLANMPTNFFFLLLQFFVLLTGKECVRLSLN